MGVLREREVQLYAVCRVLPRKNQWVEEAPLSRVVDYHLQAEAPCCCTRRPHCFCKIQLVIFTPSLPLSHFHSSRTKENPDQYVCNFTLLSLLLPLQSQHSGLWEVPDYVQSRKAAVWAPDSKHFSRQSVQRSTGPLWHPSVFKGTRIFHCKPWNPCTLHNTVTYIHLQ